jgi:uncharacterized protein (DUF433 family)
MAGLLERISIDPAVCGGTPCIKCTRIWVSLVLDLLASGMSEAEVHAEYPALTHEDILAAIAYGAAVGVRPSGSDTVAPALYSSRDQS